MGTVVARPTGPEYYEPLRWLGALLMGAHGLVHLMGVALLWRAAEPGELTYADTVPEPGSALAYAASTGWALAAGLFVGAAVLAVRHVALWRRAALYAAGLSALVVGLPLLAGSTQGVAGVVVDGVVAAVVAAAWWRERRAA